MHNPTMTTTEQTFKQHDLGNNESVSTGYRFMGEQGYLALTRAESKWFKTEAGAVRWLARRGYDAHGERIA